MKRLAAGVFLIASFVVQPAFADHGAATRSWAQRTVILEDRTGVQLVRDTAALVASRWNQSGANFTVTYRDGPATNSCGPEGNVVSICEQWVGDASGFTSWYLDGPTTMASAWIVLSPPTVRNIGIPNIRAVLAHEVGHAICCGHSDGMSIMNPFFGASTSLDAGPTEHDFEVLRAVYGTAGTLPTILPTSTSVPVTTTTTPTTATTATTTTVVPVTTTTLPVTRWSYYPAWLRALLARYGV